MVLLTTFNFFTRRHDTAPLSELSSAHATLLVNLSQRTPGVNPGLSQAFPTALSQHQRVLTMTGAWLGAGLYLLVMTAGAEATSLPSHPLWASLQE